MQSAASVQVYSYDDKDQDTQFNKRYFTELEASPMVPNYAQIKKKL